MQEQPFISVIVPVYKVEAYLRECVDSILNQTFRDFELILVDDGSPDGCPAICDEYAAKDDRVKVIHKENGGLSDARNAGIEKACGKYILFVDGDDYIGKDSLSKLKADCISDNEPDVIFLNCFKVFSNGETESLDQLYEKTSVYGNPRDEVLTYIAKQNKYPGSACTKMVARKLLKGDALKFVKGVKSEDLDWTMQLLLTAKSFSTCDANYYYYRQNRSGSISNTVTFKNYKDVSHVIDKWIEMAGKTSSGAEKSLLLSSACYEYLVMMVLYSYVEKNHRVEAFNWIKRHKHLLAFRNDKKTRIVKIFSFVFGLKFTAWIIHMLKK